LICPEIHEYSFYNFLFVQILVHKSMNHISNASCRWFPK
jgi:hypothetical protein